MTPVQERDDRTFDFTLRPTQSMRIFRKRLLITTERKIEIIEITEQLKEFVKASGINTGLVSCYNKHTTSALIIANRREEIPNILCDLVLRYSRMGLGASASLERKVDLGALTAYVGSTIFGSSLTIPIENGSILMGEWQGLFFLEMSGPREREILLTAVGI